MKFRTLIVFPGDEEDTELPQGWSLLGRAFDRGNWHLLLQKDTTTAKAPKTTEEPDLES